MNKRKTRVAMWRRTYLDDLILSMGATDDDMTHNGEASFASEKACHLQRKKKTLRKLPRMWWFRKRKMISIFPKPPPARRIKNKRKIEERLRVWRKSESLTQWRKVMPWQRSKRPPPYPMEVPQNISHSRSVSVSRKERINGRTNASGRHPNNNNTHILPHQDTFLQPSFPSPTYHSHVLFLPLFFRSLAPLFLPLRDNIVDRPPNPKKSPYFQESFLLIFVFV